MLGKQGALRSSGADFLHRGQRGRQKPGRAVRQGPARAAPACSASMVRVQILPHQPAWLPAWACVLFFTLSWSNVTPQGLRSSELAACWGRPSGRGAATAGTGQWSSEP